ncbi:MAG TPA: response regulator [Planctomycetes bacterium]|nr:response regulator [Planctomycetota bacterium]
MSIPYRILLADDDREVRGGVADLLGGIGLEVLQAETGSEALDLVRGGEPVHAALLDMYMPGPTGIEIVPLLLSERADLPCLIYSGRWSEELERAVLAAGARACLRKPVDPDRLRSEIKNVLGIRESLN